eukprot:scaffold31614_cov63-Phaeocystis_antarctica.AAC.1
MLIRARDHALHREKARVGRNVFLGRPTLTLSRLGGRVPKGEPAQEGFGRHVAGLGGFLRSCTPL